MPTPRKPFAMIREFHLADWFTLANAVCGTGALFSTVSFIETSASRHMTWLDAIQQNLWFGQVEWGGFVLHPMVLVFALSGSLMISRIRVPKP